MEERKLYGAVFYGAGFCFLGGAQHLRDFALFKGVQGALRALHYLRRHSGHPGHVDSKAVGHAAFAQFAEEDYVLAGFLDGNVEILDPLVLVFKVVEFVVMGSEEAFCAVAPLVEVFHEGTGYGHSVVGGCAAANLVQEHKGTLGEIVHNH